MEDCLKNWQEAGWGWALWNFRGSFGILDSGRKDVKYEAWEGHQLDRKMLELLQRYGSSAGGISPDRRIRSASPAWISSVGVP